VKCTITLSPGVDWFVTASCSMCRLYAVARCTLATMSAMWEALWYWVDAQRLGRGEHQWLEEVLNFRQVPGQEPVFDLYFPIARKRGEAAGGH
jgi:hypothetical protein